VSGGDAGGGTRPGPLAGVRVVDFTQNVAGPFCTMQLADLGADVLKIEPVGRGDNARTYGPPLPGGERAGFITLNRNKRSLAVNLKAPEGLALVQRLAAEADVVVENFRPGVMDKLGLGCAALRAANPGLVFASISGFGEGSPFADLGGLDLIAQGMSGLMSITGEGPGRPPVKVGVPVTDLTSGLFCCIAILGALRHRDATGEGQRVEASLLDAGIGLSVWEAGEYFGTGQRPEAHGSAHRLSAPYEALPTSDGWVNVGGASDRLWQAICTTLGCEDLIADPRFVDNHERRLHRAELAELLSACTRLRTTDDLVAALSAVGVPAGPILHYDEVLEGEHARAREMVVEQEHPTAGPARVLGVPYKLRDTPAAVRFPAPTLGQHTDATLAGLGYDAAAIAGLRERGVVG
jgi:crotonobetainyl-CoA:carnitine CoA-transferase CaiB-like acyl-CoA transferase